MINWLHTIRWKNLLIIWFSILVIILPHFNIEDWSAYFEFILWGIACTSVAAIGNITNDLWDIKQDKENKKKNIFIGGRNKKTAYYLMVFLILVTLWACISSNFSYYFLLVSLVSLVLLLAYNLFLKKLPLIGNITIALLTSLIFIGVDFIISSRIIYFEAGFKAIHIELLACFAFITTLVREIIKDAEDRKGDSFARFKTIAQFLQDKWIALLIILLCITGLIASNYLMFSRHTYFMIPFLYYGVFTFAVTIASAICLVINHPSKYIRATRIVKAGMLGCLVIYLFLSL